jgi:glutathione S-transferase
MEKLGLEYEVIPLVFGDDAETGVKGAKFLKVNPNGRGAWQRVPLAVSPR